MVNSWSTLKNLPNFHQGAAEFSIPMLVDFTVCEVGVPIPGPPIKPNEPDENPRPPGSKMRPPGHQWLKQSLSAAPDGRRDHGWGGGGPSGGQEVSCSAIYSERITFWDPQHLLGEISKVAIKPKGKAETHTWGSRERSHKGRKPTEESPPGTQGGGQQLSRSGGRSPPPPPTVSFVRALSSFLRGPVRRRRGDGRRAARQPAAWESVWVSRARALSRKCHGPSRRPSRKGTQPAVPQN